MKRAYTVGIQAIVLSSLCAFLFYELSQQHYNIQSPIFHSPDYADAAVTAGSSPRTHYPQLHTKSHEPGRTVVTTSLPQASSNSLAEDLTFVASVTPETASQTSSSEATVILTTTDNVLFATSSAKSNEGTLETENTEVQQEDASSTEEEQPSKSEDAPAMKNTDRYIQAIMNPYEPIFENTLQCSSPKEGRYEYLRPTSTTSFHIKPKYFFALDLYECADLLPRLLGSIIEAITFLGPANCELSIIEGRSKDGTTEILSGLAPELSRLGTTYHFNTSNINPKAGDGTDRIAALAELRNLALYPLMSQPENYDPATTVVFINDVSLCAEDILELLHQRLAQDAHMTCGMDWIFGGAIFYDVWVSRGINGDQLFEIPQSGTWDYSDNLFWNDRKSRELFDHGKPFQVFACWNGVTAFTAEPLLKRQLRFRRSYEEECYHGEPTLFAKDLWYYGYDRIAVVPSVNVGYSDNESKQVKNSKGTVSNFVAHEEEQGKHKIEWQSKPPPVVKCVPTYQYPQWVPWNEGLEKHHHESEGTWTPSRR